MKWLTKSRQVFIGWLLTTVVLQVIACGSSRSSASLYLTDAFAARMLEWCLLFRGGILIRTHDGPKSPHMPLFLRAILGPN